MALRTVSNSKDIMDSLSVAVWGKFLQGWQSIYVIVTGCPAYSPNNRAHLRFINPVISRWPYFNQYRRLKNVCNRYWVRIVLPSSQILIIHLKGLWIWYHHDWRQRAGRHIFPALDFKPFTLIVEYLENIHQPQLNALCPSTKMPLHKVSAALCWEQLRVFV